MRRPPTNEGTIGDLGHIAGSGIADIDKKGQVVGIGFGVGPFLYSKGTLTYLGTLGGYTAWATGINDDGQVIGNSATVDGHYHAFLYSKGTMTDLGTLGGSSSRATAINDKGEVVGYSDTTGDLAYHAFLYSDGTMTDLTQVVYDLFLVDDFLVNGINKAGQIIGTGIWDGNKHAFILTVPKK